MEIELRRAVLQEHIARRNISQNNFAMRAKISSGYMAQILVGKRKPSGPVRARLMKASGLSFDDLFVIVSESVGRKEAAYADPR